MDPLRPWTDAETLAHVLAGWRQLYAGRELFRVAAGPGWVRLHLAGNEHAGLLLCDLPGARLVVRHVGRLPAALTAALPVARKHPLQALLTGAHLVSCGLLPDDRVVAIHLNRSQAGDVVLLHRLFGARGNTTLVDRDNKLLWSRHRPPHAALAIWPVAATFTTGCSANAPHDYDPLALTRMLTACAQQALTTNRATLNRRLKANRRLLANLDRDLLNADQGDSHRHKAEALAANLHNLTQGAAEVVLTNLTDGTPLTIALDPALTPAANMEAWFRRARKAVKGLAIIRERRDATASEQERLEAVGTDLDTIEQRDSDPAVWLAELQEWRASHAELFPRSETRPRQRAAEEPARPFRRYLIDGSWEVWVGRSSRENDELTHRAAHQRDIWLHAQGVTGSHVILRTGGHPERVPRAILEKAAALAALNSKARNSGIVPVIHTEKRYVRKPRKAAAGTAVCLRDQSLFVEPGIMKGVEPT